MRDDRCLVNECGEKRPAAQAGGPRARELRNVPIDWHRLARLALKQIHGLPVGRRRRHVDGSPYRGDRCFKENADPSARSSTLMDLEAGRRLELESLAGTAVRLGKELGVPTPLNEVVYAALKPYVNGHPSFQKKYKNRRSCLVVHLGMRFTYARSTPVTLL